MNKMVDTLESNLTDWREFAEAMLNAFSLLCIIAGIIFSIVRSVQYKQRIPRAHPLHSYFRMIFGGRLVIVFEFQLAADIVDTTISLTTAPLIELGDWRDKNVSELRPGQRTERRERANERTR